MGPDTPHPDTTTSMTFSPVEPRKDGMVVLRKDPASRSNPQNNATPTPTSSSPRPSANSRFISALQAGLASSSPPLTPVAGGLLHPVDEEPDTPSSTIVEFGDLTRGYVPSAAQLVESIHRSWSHSQASLSESHGSNKGWGAQEKHDNRGEVEERNQDRAKGASNKAPRERSRSTHRIPPNAGDTKGASLERTTASEKGLADERINRFLQSMAQQGAQNSETSLVQENKSLYQRISALQLTERELLAENQDLTRKLAALKQHHERRARQWNEGLRRKDIEYEARMRELGEQFLDLVSRHPQTLPTILSNEEISAWFDDQDTAWNGWARAFGHRDPARLSTVLHPLQLQELCDDVKGFVRMTDAGGLAPEIVGGGREALQTLLNGMLANFICEEIIASPMWVFVATSLGTLESPGIVAAKPLPGLPAVGFRMDMNSFNDVAPVRPGPCQTPKSPQFPPPLITSMMGSTISSASLLGLPTKPDMERLLRMLTEAQEDESRVSAYYWRAQMMRLFAEGGFALKDVAAAGRNESRRTFVESRLNLARKLKERFLGTSARFLLQDQDAAGIENLETELGGMIDDALRFSCRLWTRVAPHRLHGWRDLGSKEVRSATPLVTLCHAQAEVEAHDRQHKTPNANQSGSPEVEQPIVMVVQPAVVTESIHLPGVNVGSGNDGVALVWLRARVMLAGPMAPEIPNTPPAGVGSQVLPQANTANTTSAGGTPRVDTPKALELLPASSFKASEGPAQ